MKGTEKNWGVKNPNGSLFDTKVLPVVFLFPSLYVDLSKNLDEI